MYFAEKKFFEFIRNKREQIRIRKSLKSQEAERLRQSKEIARSKQIVSAQNVSPTNAENSLRSDSEDIVEIKKEFHDVFTKVNDWSDQYIPTWQRRGMRPLEPYAYSPKTN